MTRKSFVDIIVQTEPVRLAGLQDDLEGKAHLAEGLLATMPRRISFIHHFGKRVDLIRAVIVEQIFRFSHLKTIVSLRENAVTTVAFYCKWLVNVL